MWRKIDTGNEESFSCKERRVPVQALPNYSPTIFTTQNDLPLT